MADAVKINAIPREGKGSAEGRRLRREGFFPGVVYGAGRENLLVKVNEHAFHQGLVGHASEHLLLDLDIEGQDSRKVMLQEVQHDALTGRIVHADFHEVSMTEKLRVEVQLELVGTPVGVSRGGGVLEHLVRTVEIECLPGDLMEVIELDVSGLNIGEHLTAGDIQLDSSKFTLISDPDLNVASVAEPTKEVESAAGEGAEGAAEGASAGQETAEASGKEED